jgi:hypothetical protein
MRQIDIRNIEMPGKRPMQIRLRNRANVDERTPELASRIALFSERLLELRFGDQLLLEKQVAKPNTFARCRLLGHRRRALLEVRAHVRDTSSGRLNDTRPVGIVVNDDRPQENDELCLGLELACAAE